MLSFLQDVDAALRTAPDQDLRGHPADGAVLRFSQPEACGARPYLFQPSQGEKLCVCSWFISYNVTFWSVCSTGNRLTGAGTEFRIP